MARSRLLVLYLRSRGVPATTGGLVALVVVIGGATQGWGWILPDVLGAFIAVLVAALLVGGVATPSSELDASAPLPWWRWRVGHVLVGVVVGAMPLSVACARCGGAGIDPAVVRNVMGFVGLALITAVVAGAWLSWVTPFVYALITWVFLPSSSSWVRMWLWPALSPATELSWWLPAAFCLLGTFLLATRGTPLKPG